mmetsp:Transcript_20775/g.68634  ORF Transcript_20775/g.68634 Transcript_20775/m.68634 type:complete len:123 (+) Transcript_20775:1576-1944(+)
MFQLERYPVLPPSTTWRQLKPAHNAGRFRVCIFEVQQFPFDVSEGAKYTPPHAVEAYLNLMPRQSPHWKRYPLRACVSGGDCELFSANKARIARKTHLRALQHYRASWDESTSALSIVPSIL